MLRRSALLGSVGTLVHGFTTGRRGEEPGSPRLDLGSGAPAEAWAAVSEALGVPGAPIAISSQVHGDVVLTARGGGLQGEGDGLVSDQPGLLVAVRVADCVPVLLVGLDAAGDARVVAAVHAGWRGLAVGVIAVATRELRRRVSERGAGGRILASVGPCIGVDSYEVGPEVIAGIAGHVPVEVFARPGRREGRWQADLRAAAAWQLTQAGVDALDQVQGCSVTDPLLHSHRRDGAASGRMAGVIGLRR